MKSLETIQKTFRVFQILAKVFMILSFVWAGLSALGLLCGIVWYSGGTVVGANQELLHTLTETNGLNQLIAALLVDTIAALTDGILLAFAYRYFKTEQAVGTPFTHEGADQIRRLGVRAIVLPLVTVILIAVVYAMFGMPQGAGSDWSNISSVSTGIVLILASIIFRYGADLEKKTAASAFPALFWRTAPSPGT